MLKLHGMIRRKKSLSRYQRGYGRIGSRYKPAPAPDADEGLGRKHTSQYLTRHYKLAGCPIPAYLRGQS